LPIKTSLLLLACALLALSAAYGSALPADGGDVGKAYRACLEALAKPDKPGIIALCFPKDDPWLAKTNLDYFTPETFALEVRQLRTELRLVDVVITGGEVNGDKADLRVTGRVLVQRLESWGEIVSTPPYPVKGTVSLVRFAVGWRPSGSELERVFE
jgi:hypothetical protein